MKERFKPKFGVEHCVCDYYGVCFWLAYRIFSWFASQIFFSELCQFYGLGLLQCLHLVGPKQQDRIGKASESASDSF
jgi:hypothetical protein